MTFVENHLNEVEQEINDVNTNFQKIKEAFQPNL